MKGALRGFLRTSCAAEDFLEGGRLYPRYKAQLRVIAEHYGVGISAVCGAFAALSPNSRIEANLRSLVTCLEGIRQGVEEERIVVDTYRRMRPSALAILRGEVDFTDVCKGDKITAFRSNLLFLSDSRRVTIDGHMLRIMLNRPTMTMREAEMAKREAGGYAVFERAFLAFADRHCTDRTGPCDLQAVMWSAARRLHGRGVELWRVRPVEEIKPYPWGEVA